MPSMAGIINLNKGTHRKPVTMDTIAPFSVYPSQDRDRIITGQKVAAIPDQPKIINQKTVLSGNKTDTSRATPKAKNAKIRVTFFERPIKKVSSISGRIIC